MSAHLPLADITFIAEFAAFARAKGGGAYRYSDFTNCACAQFLKASGRCAKPLVYAHHWEDEAGGEHWFPGGFASPIGIAISDGDHTFSALADRLEALITDAPVVRQA